MSKFEIKMPKLGESITEGTIVSWSVKVGDMIQEDDVLFEVNTAKVSAEIPSPVAGKVEDFWAAEGPKRGRLRKSTGPAALPVPPALVLGVPQA